MIASRYLIAGILLLAAATTACSKKSSSSSTPKPASTDATETEPAEHGTATIGDECEESSDCTSSFCLHDDKSTAGVCTKTCEADIDCPNADYHCVIHESESEKVCIAP